MEEVSVTNTITKNSVGGGTANSRYRKKENLNIAIVTFYSNFNYGAALQCYALQKFITESGYHVKILDFKRGLKRADSALFMPNLSVKKLFNLLRFLPINLRKSKLKSRFKKKYYVLSKKYREKKLKQSNGEFNCFIAGSDQIWNYNLSTSYLTYLLNFADDNAKKISYAASFGVSRLDNNYYDIYKKLLKRFNYLSVREMQGKNIISELEIDKNVEVVLDPVFLLSREEWTPIIKQPKKNDYILVYSFVNKKTLGYALKLAERTGKELVYLGSIKKEKGNFMQVRALGPVEWLSWIAYADYVVTDSFHGTAFSIIFNKKFISFSGNGKNATNSRLETLLSKAGLTERLFSDSVDENIVNKEIDYKKVSMQLASEIKHSQKFLKRALSE